MFTTLKECAVWFRRPGSRARSYIVWHVQRLLFLLKIQLWKLKPWNSRSGFLLPKCELAVQNRKKSFKKMFVWILISLLFCLARDAELEVWQEGSPGDSDVWGCRAVVPHSEGMFLISLGSYTTKHDTRIGKVTIMVCWQVGKSL